MIETRKRSTILNLVIAAIILLIAFLFWPSGSKYAQSNKIDVSQTQIKVLLRRINIRKEPDVKSEDIGDVFRGEVYTVLEQIEKKDYYWYKIKTDSGIEGYIGSDPNEEYVKVISGYIDREAPEIKIKKEPLIIVNGKTTLDDVECIDDHSSCSLSYEEKDSDTLLFKAVDDDNNKSQREVNYYKVYELVSEFYDNGEKINAKFSVVKKSNYYLIHANYQLNKTIPSAHKSINYYPVMNFYDEDFKELDISAWYNSEELKASCINTEDNILKDEYKNIDLLKGNSICINYRFNKDPSIKYIGMGFYGVENYDHNENIFANYFSKYFMIN